MFGCFLYGPVWGRGTPLPPLSITSSSFPLFTFSFLSLALPIFIFCPSLPFLPEQGFKVKGQRSRSQRENIVWSSYYCALLGNLSRWICWRCQNFDRKLQKLAVCAHAQYKLAKKTAQKWLSSVHERYSYRRWTDVRQHVLNVTKWRSGKNHTCLYIKERTRFTTYKHSLTTTAVKRLFAIMSDSA